VNRALALVLLAACGLSPEEFEERNTENYCAALEDCGSLIRCDDATGSTVATSPVSDCAFDAGAARDCLDGTWRCDTAQTPVPPEPCEAVYDCDEAG
jgi:hypothetical protein